MLVHFMKHTMHQLQFQKEFSDAHIPFYILQNMSVK